MRYANIQKQFNVDTEAVDYNNFGLSVHAKTRMSQRNIDMKQVHLVLQLGKVIHSRKARFYVIGRKNIGRLSHQGIDAQSLENIQVVVDDKSNLILTVYKNSNFRQIRPKQRRERYMH